MTTTDTRPLPERLAQHTTHLRAKRMPTQDDRTSLQLLEELGMKHCRTTPASAEALSREQLEALRGHTPGPWIFDPEMDGLFYQHPSWPDYRMRLAHLLCEEVPEDARLIAAAPDLLTTALAALARAEVAEARVTEALAAIDAAIQCETDLLDMYQRRTSLTTLDLAVADLKRDSLPKLKAARAALAGGAQ